MSSTRDGNAVLRGKLDAFQVLRAQNLVVLASEELAAAYKTKREEVSLLGIRRALQELLRLAPRTRLLQLAALSNDPPASPLAVRLARLATITSLVCRRLGLDVALARDAGAAACLSGIGRGLGDELIYANVETCVSCNVYLEALRWALPFGGEGRQAALRVVAAHGQLAHATRRGGHPVARLVAVVDRYERLRAPEPNGAGLRPDEAMRRLASEPDLDAAAAEALTATLGLFPIGSPVRLSNGASGVVIDVPGDPSKLRQPRILVMHGSEEREIVDTGAAGLTVTESLDMAQLQLNLKDFLFA